jgi:hypothetical protein
MKKNFRRNIHIILGIFKEISGLSKTIALVNIDSAFNSFFVKLIRFFRF